MSGPRGGRERGSSGAISQTAQTRASGGGEDFLASFHELQGVIGGACRSAAGWEAKVVGGIRAALSFAAAEPAKARALTIDARRPAFGERNPEQVVLAYFAKLLAEVTPAYRKLPVSTDEAVVEAMAAMVRGHLLGGTADQLPGTAPDMAYLALMPYLGIEKTRRWAETAAPETTPQVR